MRRIVLVVAMVAGLGGCLRTYELDMEVPAPGPRTALGGAPAPAFKLSVVDARADKTRIGGGETIPATNDTIVIRSAQPTEKVVAQGIEAEFSARGLRVGDGTANLLVDIVLLDSHAVWGLFRTDVSAQVWLAARVIDHDGRILHSRRYERSDKGTVMALIGNSGQGKERLEQVLATTIQDMAEDGALVAALVKANRQR